MNRKLILAFGLLLAGPVTATDLTLLAGYQFNSDFELSDESGDAPEPVDGEPGDDVPVDEGGAVGLAMDFVFRNQEDKRIGFFLSRHQTKFDPVAGLTDRDMDITHLHFTGTSYYPSGNWEPFVLAGVGASHFAPKDSSLKDTTRFSVQLGAGTNYRFTESLLLRLEARWIPAFFDGSSAGICSGGCTIAIKSESYSQAQVNLGLMFRF